jgi:hypothetical protein
VTGAAPEKMKLQIYAKISDKNIIQGSNFTEALLIALLIAACA